MNEQEVFAALIKREPKWLDRPIQDLVKMQAVGSVFLDTHRSILRKLKTGQIALAEDDRRARLAEGQAIGRALLDVEAKIGELSLQEPQARGPGAGGGKGGLPSGQPPKHKRLGLSSDHAMVNAQAIARHPEAVAQVIAEAKHNEDIPTKTAVLNKIRFDAERERRIKAEKREKPQSVLSLEQAQYLNTLERVISILPARPPKDWNEPAFKRAQAMAEIIIKRLEAFIDGTRKNITD